jgi:formimidoylglutamate deiminase
VTARRFRAALTWIDGRFQPDREIVVDAEGRIVRIDAADGHRDGGAADDAASSAPGEVCIELPNRAILPGFVSAHSHAFQRGLRGFGERFPRGVGSFWSWREAMYGLVERLTPEEFERLCARNFAELLRTGVTTVGEFHYLHHVDAEVLDFGLDYRVLAAARDAGIRIALLVTFYKTGGIGQPLAGGQRRFATPDVSAFLKHVERLAGKLDAATQSIGIAAHSVRAVPAHDLKTLHAAARANGWPIHMHLEEQPREIEDCIAAYGVRPIEWVMRQVDVGPEFTAIHATYTPAEWLKRWTGAGGFVCLCPLTEANLGDGLADVAALNAAPGKVCVGTDSNARLDFVEELRWLEYGGRLKSGLRGLCADSEGQVASRLIDFGTANGAAALNLGAGVLESGRPADFFTIDLRHPAVQLAPHEMLAESLLFGAGAETIREVFVGGNPARVPA